MREDKLSIQSMDFAVDIINLVKELKSKRESIISNQIGRSGTSIGANIREAHYAHGTVDFDRICRFFNEAFLRNIKSLSLMKLSSTMKCAFRPIRNASLHKSAKRIDFLTAKPSLHICR